ncbi:hypothetical protein TRIP_C20414 [Candidatus Zixiibacteriota bacterium]|nr:hypothetical protein TRIP_C20414 [candidate division Zixibacteria bacterium]
MADPKYKIYSGLIRTSISLLDNMIPVLMAFLITVLSSSVACSSAPQDSSHVSPKNAPADSLPNDGNIIPNPNQHRPDSTRPTIGSEPLNRHPIITSPSNVEASEEIPFRYKASYRNNGLQGISSRFESFPSWLTADHDSLFGIPGIGAADSSFVLIVSDGTTADTQHVAIQMMRPIVVYGDTRTGHDQHRQLVNLITNIRPLSVFHVGDLVADGNIPSDWDTLNAIIGNLRTLTEYYPALGNHEHQSPLFFANFDLPHNEEWYSVNRNHIHWIILNTCVAIAPGSEQYRWLEQDLASVPDSIKFIVPVFHHPPYSTGPHTEDEMGLRNTLVPLFQQYSKIGIVFIGHDHDYERSYCGGIYYIVTGGGGAPLRDQARTHPCSQLFLKTYEFCKVQVVDRTMYLKVFDINNNIIDRLDLPAR